MKRTFSILSLAWLLVTLMPTYVGAQGFTEPTLYLYGRVRQSQAGAEHILQSGQMQITLVNVANSANTVTRTVTLRPVGAGEQKPYSYLLSVPLKSYVPAHELTEFIEVKGGGTQIRIASVLIDGAPARLASQEDEVISVSQINRADERRVDFLTNTPALDSDGDGMPDWWEEVHGLNPFFAGDAGGDLDDDLLTNRQEYDLGTNPNDIGEGNRVPTLLTQQITLTRDGLAGVALRVVDSDTPATGLTVTLTALPAGMELRRATTPLSLNATFTMAEVEAGMLSLRDEETAQPGSLELSISDGVHAAVPVAIRVELFQPSTPSLRANLWLDARSLALANGAPVAAWPDRAGNLDSGNPRALVQPTAAARPAFATTGGRSGVTFSGPSHSLLGGDVALPASTQALFVFYAPTGDAPAEQSFLESNSLSYRLAPFDGPVGYPGAPSLTVGDQMIKGFRTKSGSAFLTAFRLTDEQGFALSAGLFNGSPVPGGAGFTPVIPALGALVRPDLDNPTTLITENPFRGTVHEVLLYDRLLSDGFAQSVETYLLSRWQDAVIWNYREELVGLTLNGGAGPDFFQGGYAADLINGGAGEDLIQGGPGVDILTGGTDADIFIYRVGDWGNDIIKDFATNGANHDVLDLSGLFLGKTGNAAPYISLQSQVEIIGGNVVAKTLVKLDLAGDGGTPDLTLTLEGIARSNTDLGWLLGEGIILMGELKLDTEVGLSTLAIAIQEGQTADSGKLKVTVTRSGNIAGAQVVPLSVGGTATYLLDFTLEGVGGTTNRPTVTFARGQATAQFYIIPIVDPVPEDPETITVQVVPRERDYRTSAAPPSLTLNESVHVTLSGENSILARNAGLTGTLTVNRTGATTSPLSVLLNLTGTAVVGVDYLPLPSSIVIPAGAGSASLNVTPVAGADTAVRRLDIRVAPSPGNYAAIAPWTCSFLFAPGSSVDTVGFENWRAVNDPGATGTPIADYATLDSDLDGESNLEEYLNGTNPLDPNSHGTFQLSFWLSPTNKNIAVSQGAQRPDVFIDVERSTDLDTWQNVTDSLTLVASNLFGTEGLSRHFTQAYASGSLGTREFFRASARFRNLALLLGGDAQLLSSDGVVYPMVTTGSRSWKPDLDAGEGFTIDGLATGQKSSLSVAISGPAVVSFEWKASGDSTDTLVLFVDSVQNGAAIPGGTPWTQRQLNLTAGDHLLRWEYTEGGSSANGSADVRRLQVQTP